MSASSSNPYSILAEIYDHVMAHVEYDAWADYIHELLVKYGKAGGRILDAGCGTAKHIKRLRKYGYAVFGFDASMDMIQMSSQENRRILWQGDMRAIAAKQSFDVVICLYDTIHYLKEEDLSEFFSQCSQVLKSDGLFIFDAVTEKFLRGYWANYTEWDETEDWVITRRSWYERREKCQHTVIDMTDHSSSKGYTEHHLQWSYSLSKLKQLGYVNGFDVLEIYEAQTLNLGSEDADRNHFVFVRRSD